MPRPGKLALAEALVAQGIDHVVSVPGESDLDVLDGLYERGEQLRHITCCLKAGAVNMAEAYGKGSGRGESARS